MIKLKVSIVILVLFLCFLRALTENSYAQSPPIYGPSKYLRSTGAPNTFTDSFQSCNTGAGYKVVVENGEAGKGRISSGTISLNGNEIVNQNDLSQKVEKIERSVSLQAENTLNVKLASGPNGFIKVSVYCETNCLEVKITSPETGSTINKFQTIIRGDLYNAMGETGVVLQSWGAIGTVSSVAQTQGIRFAGTTPLQQGQNTITATATDVCGYQAMDIVTINTQTLDEKLRLTANPESGISTLNVSLEAETNLPNSISTYSWDTNGDRTPDQDGSDLTKITVSYQLPGLYFPKVAATDTQNNTYTETTIVNVMSREEMDALLKAKWEGMKAKLIGEDIEGALAYFNPTSQDRYRQIFTTLGSTLSDFAVKMKDIQLIYLYNGTAKYRIKKNEICRGQSLTITYYIYFIIDNEGLWVIDKF